MNLNKKFNHAIYENLIIEYIIYKQKCEFSCNVVQRKQQKTSSLINRKEIENFS